MAVSTFQPQDSKFADRVRASFARQGAMRLIGATLDAVTRILRDVTGSAHNSRHEASII